MKELIQIRDAVMQALEDAGLCVLAAFPAGRMKQYDGPVAAVAVGAAEGKNLGFCNYLGQIYDEEAGTVRELYGKQLDAVIATDIRASSAADCETGCEKAADTLLGGLPSGLRPGELAWEALCWEKETGMFLRRGKLRCQALFTAQTEEEAATFLDFTLRGVLTT